LALLINREGGADQDAWPHTCTSLCLLIIFLGISETDCVREMVFGFRMILFGMESLVGWAEEWKAERARSINVQVELDQWYAKLQNASCYEEWLASARHLDELEGCDEWKREPGSPHYDSKRMQQQSIEMTRLQAEGDYGAIVYWLRSGLHRNFAGIHNPLLYRYCHVGTKVLIENYNEELLRMLQNVCHCREDEISLESKLNFFTESRHGIYICT